MHSPCCPGAWPRIRVIDEARQALEDGLPQVAIYNLSQAPKFAREDQPTAELLLARALFAAGRFQESARLLKKSGAASAEARFWLAEANAALNKPDEALTLYQSLGQDERFASQAAVGTARMLCALGRTSEASESLSAFLKRNPASPGDAALELAQIRLDAGDNAGALSVLSSAEGFSPEQQQHATYLTARALLASGEPAKAEEKLKEIKDPPASLAANLAVALAECRLRRDEAGDAERIMETYIEENSRLPGTSRRVRGARPHLCPRGSCVQCGTASMGGGFQEWTARCTRIILSGTQ